MTKLNLYWQSKTEWLEYDANRMSLKPKNDAPDDIKESYRIYLEQLKTKEEYI